MTLKRRYDEITDRVEVTDEMRRRILDKLQETEAGPRPAGASAVRVPQRWKGYLAACMAQQLDWEAPQLTTVPQPRDLASSSIHSSLRILLQPKKLTPVRSSGLSQSSTHSPAERRSARCRVVGKKRSSALGRADRRALTEKMDSTGFPRLPKRGCPRYSRSPGGMPSLAGKSNRDRRSPAAAVSVCCVRKRLWNGAGWAPPVPAGLPRIRGRPASPPRPPESGGERVGLR